MKTNTQVKLAKRPIGLPGESTWTLEKNALPIPQEGEVLIRTIYVSLDPAMRGWLNDQKSYIPPVQIGEVMRAGTLGQVIESNNPNFQAGDYVTGWTGVQEYAVSSEPAIMKIDPDLIPLPAYLSVMGMPGLTAYFGLLEVGKPQAGETVLVSGAAGAVGSVVGQIAKIKGCRAVGIAGGDEKCRYILEELGFDAAIDYKNEKVYAALKNACPNGVDVYFDNVGGEILDIALSQINLHARIPICGAISQYNRSDALQGPSNYLSLLVNRARMEGFIVFDYQKAYPKAIQEMGQWLSEGKLKSKEHIVEGIENFHSAFLRLFSGQKLGKLILKIG